MNSTHTQSIVAAVVLLAAVGTLLFMVTSTKTVSWPKLNYPQARTADQVDDYHGTKVADPYRWLEDIDSTETRDWVAAQNAITQPLLENLPHREAFKKRISELMDNPEHSLPSHHGSYWFWYENTGLQNQDILYVGNSADDANRRVLLDPNTLSSNGTVALNALSCTKDGTLMAYALSSAGSDWQEWHVRDVATGKDLPDVLKWSKFSGASWSKDGKGFYYCRYDEPKEEDKLKNVNYFQKLYYHKLGTDQAQDVLVYDRPDKKDWMFSGSVTEDGRYLIITVSHSADDANQVFVKDLESAGEVVELFNKNDARYYFTDNVGEKFYFTTTNNAPRWRVVSVEFGAGSNPALTEVIPQADSTLEGCSRMDNKLIATYLHDAHSQVKVFNSDGSLLREVKLPGLGSVGGFGGNSDEWETYYSYTSFNTPAAGYKYDLRTGVSTPYYTPNLKFNPDDFVTEQVFYTSKDGVKVPMFITYKKGLVKNGNNPTYLYGYGGFNISLQPSYSSSKIAWMERGGIYAQASLRGGGEYGEEWHEAGTQLQKQNVFNDFISAGEWLIENGYTSKAKLAIGGGSNGGLLVGACLLQRPDLFGAAIPEVGVMDMLRFHKFTIGWAWTADYGSSDNAEQFKALYAYSPVHNVKPGTAYPPTLIMTADHDDRVYPAHSFKFAAALQAGQGGRAPILIRIETDAGHGAGKPTSKAIAEASERWAFLAYALQMAPPK